MHEETDQLRDYWEAVARVPAARVPGLATGRLHADRVVRHVWGGLPSLRARARDAGVSVEALLLALWLVALREFDSGQELSLFVGPGSASGRGASSRAWVPCAFIPASASALEELASLVQEQLMLGRELAASFQGHVRGIGFEVRELPDDHAVTLLEESGQSALSLSLVASVVLCGARLALAVAHPDDALSTGVAGALAASFVARVSEVSSTPPSAVGAVHVHERRLVHRAVRELARGHDVPIRGWRLEQRLLQSCRAHRDGVAVVQAGTSTTYAELERWSHALEAELAPVIEREEPVLLVAQPGLSFVVGMLGILRAGGTFVPLEPEAPSVRLRRIIDNLRIRIAVTDGSLPRVAGCRVVPVMQHQLGGRCPPPEESAHSYAARPAHPDSLAYVIHTSGSTGVPKAVGVSHAAITHYLDWARTSFPTRSRGSVVHSRIGVDLGLTAILLPLILGETLHCTDSNRPVPALASVLTRTRAVGLLKVTPSQLQMLTKWSLDSATPVRVETLVIGGETLASEVVAGLPDWLRATKIVNEYGPTEATVGCVAVEVERRTRACVHPIGRPISRMRAYVLNGAGAPVAVGALGELYVAGAGLARGYLGNPRATAAAFVPDPFAPTPGQRMYRTGDRAYTRAGRDLVHVDRIDDQLKHRGIRIELGEVETAVASFPGIRVAAAAVRVIGGRDELVAFYHGQVPDGELAIREHVERILPRESVPARFIPLEVLPLGPGGKLRRSELPAISTEVQPSRPRVEGLTPVQQRIASIWQQLLGRPTFGLEENIFDAGAHSFMLVDACGMLRAEFGREVQVVELFERPTVEAQAGLFETTPVRGSSPRELGPRARAGARAAARSARASARAGRKRGRDE